MEGARTVSEVHPAEIEREAVRAHLSTVCHDDGVGADGEPEHKVPRLGAEVNILGPGGVDRLAKEPQIFPVGSVLRPAPFAALRRHNQTLSEEVRRGPVQHVCFPCRGFPVALPPPAADSAVVVHPDAGLLLVPTGDERLHGEVGGETDRAHVLKPRPGPPAVHEIRRLVALEDRFAFLVLDEQDLSMLQQGLVGFLVDVQPVHYVLGGTLLLDPGGPPYRSDVWRRDQDVAQGFKHICVPPFIPDVMVVELVLRVHILLPDLLHRVGHAQRLNSQTDQERGGLRGNLAGQGPRHPVQLVKTSGDHALLNSLSSRSSRLCYLRLVFSDESEVLKFPRESRDLPLSLHFRFHRLGDHVHLLFQVEDR